MAGLLYGAQIIKNPDFCFYMRAGGGAITKMVLQLESD